MHKLKYMDGRCILIRASKIVFVMDVKATNLGSKERSVSLILKLDLTVTTRQTKHSSDDSLIANIKVSTSLLCYCGFQLFQKLNCYSSHCFVGHIQLCFISEVFS